MTPSGAFGFYAGLCCRCRKFGRARLKLIYIGPTVVGCVFVTFCYPNTAGLSIEETRVIFKDSFGIKAADRLRADKAAAYDAGMAQ